MDSLHATIEEFAAQGFTHVQCYCPRCRMMRLRPISWLPRISMGLTIALRGTGTPFTPALIAFFLLVGELVLFWGFTAPVNRATENWTMLPGNWEQLRAQWEYSHAARAFLYVLAMGTLVMSILEWRSLDR